MIAITILTKGEGGMKKWFTQKRGPRNVPGNRRRGRINQYPLLVHWQKVRTLEKTEMRSRMEKKEGEKDENEAGTGGK